MGEGIREKLSCSGSGFDAGYVTAQISGTTGHPIPLANVTLSALNGGFAGFGNTCRFAVQVTRQP